MSDLRVQKTRVAIKAAFVDLVLAQGFNAVTVIAISKRAMINRKTFYQHFIDKYQLADQLTEDILDEFEKVLGHRAQLVLGGQGMDEASVILQPEFEALLTRWRRPIAAVVTIPEVQSKLVDRVMDSLSLELARVLNRPASKLEISVIGGLMIGMLRYDLKENQFPTKAEVQSLVASIAMVLKGR